MNIHFLLQAHENLQKAIQFSTPKAAPPLIELDKKLMDALAGLGVFVGSDYGFHNPAKECKTNG